MRQTQQAKDLRSLLGMTALVVIPAALALRSVRVPGTLVIPSDDPSPYGYTWSLLLFIAPVVAIERALARHACGQPARRAFWLAVIAFFCIGAFLDLGFAYNFFTFPNRGAVLGLYLPAFDFMTCRWHAGYLPVEEFAFYYFGALFTIGLYGLGDLTWASSSQVPLTRPGRLIKFNPCPLFYGGLVIAAAWIYKLWIVPGTGVPGYFTFLMCLGVLPTCLLLEAVGPTLNFRSLGFMYAALVLISLLWEATLGVPYGWWNYQHDMMLGLYIGPWSDLPIEAVLLWLVAGWGAVVLFQALLLWQVRRAGEAPR